MNTQAEIIFQAVIKNWFWLILICGAWFFSFKSRKVCYRLDVPCVSKAEADGTIKIENKIGNYQVRYTTKDAFMVLTPILVEISLEWLKPEMFQKEEKLFARFHGAVNICNDQEKKFNIDNTAQIKLKFEKSKKRWIGQGKIRYQVPGAFPVTISKEDLSDIIRFPEDWLVNKVHIASSDVLYQIKISKLITFLTSLGIIITLIQLIRCQ